VVTAPTVGVVPNQPAIGSITKIIVGNPPAVELAIDGATQQVKAGEQIGNSGWILTRIDTAGNEVVIQRNGELRNLKVGQQF
jgi:hypothetical protein